MAKLFPENEEARQRELASYQVLGTAPERAFDELVALAAEICEAPIALITLIDNDRQWFKAKIGMEAEQTPREQAFCAHAILEPNKLMVVSDAASDARFARNPLVTGDPHIRFYAGAPLVSDAGNGLGTLCVIDRQPRKLRPSQERALHALSAQAVQLLDLHRQRVRAEQQKRFLRTITETLAEGVIVRDRQRILLYHNTMASVLLGARLEDLVGKTFSMLQFKPVQPNGRSLATEDLPSYRALETGDAQKNFIFGITRPDNRQVWLEANASVVDDPAHGDCAVISFRDVTDRRTLETKLQQDASSDLLTGLLNRRAFLAQVERAIAGATRHKHPMSLCAGDLDHLKQINDNFGHAAGDAALRHFAKMLRANLRHEDTAGRFGGDEFVALFAYVSATQASVCIDRLRRSFANGRLRLEGGREITLSGSFGVADWKSGMSAEQLLAAADKALYDAKSKGRNRTSVSS